MENEVTRNVRVPDHVSMSVIQSSINLRTQPHEVFPVSAQEFWTMEDMGRELYQYNDKGHLLRTIKCWLPIRSVTMTSPTEMVVIDDKAHCVKKVDLTKEDKNVSLLIRTNALQVPTAICLNSAKELVVGATIDDGAMHRLAIYSGTGTKVLNTIETYREGDENKPTFPAPISKVVQNGNGDYIVLCGKELLAVDDKGNIRWRYAAEHKGKRAADFRVGGYVCDKHNHILVSDTSNSEIDMLDPDGKFLMCLMTRSKLNDKPLGLAIDNKNNLHLGQADKSIFIVTYLR